MRLIGVVIYTSEMRNNITKFSLKLALSVRKALPVEEFIQGNLGPLRVGEGEGEIVGVWSEDDVLSTCKTINTHVSQWYFQAAEELCRYSRCCERIMRIGNLLFFGCSV